MHRYQARLAARPLLTQAITTSFLFGIGDVAAQQLVEKRGAAGHDLARTGRMALYGGGEILLHRPGVGEAPRLEDHLAAH